MKAKFKISSVRIRLLIIFTSLLVLSLGLMSGVSYYFSKQFLVKSVNQTAMSVGTDYANRVQSSINELTLRVEDLAAIPNVRNGSDSKQIMEIMIAEKQRIGKFDVIAFIYPDGNAVKSDGTTGYLGDREYFKKIVNTKVPYVSDPVIARATGKLSIQVAVPVLYNGNLTGVITAAYSLDSLSSLIEEIKFQESGYGFLADATGKIIAYPNEPELIGKLNIAQKTVNPEVTLQAGELDNRLINLFKNSLASNQQASGEYILFNDVTNVAVATAINLAGGQRWVLMVTAPETEVTKDVSSLTQIVVFVLLGCTLIASLFILYVSKQFAQPITVMRDEALLVSAGDLRLRQTAIQSEDEIGQLAGAFQKMTDHLRHVIITTQSQAELVAASSEELTASAQQSADTANQVAASITQIAQGSGQQAAEINSMSTVIAEISAKIKQTSETAKMVAGIATETSNATDNGRQAIEKATEQMKQIGKSSEVLHDVIKELAKGSCKIGEIISLISSIAGQTNLLALNAAIEAARAGEHGRGFAVVAEEVRKLAEGSNQAAQQIANLIKKNEQDMNEAIIAAQASGEGVQVGIDIVSIADETFQSISASVVQLSTQIQEMQQEMDQIALGSQEVVEYVHRIDKVSKENATESQTVSAATEEQSASVQEIASSSQGLANAAGDMQTAVEKFIT
ncbi:methyl-accepting chemotaxis protein [Pelosinus propionicus]|uniref:Methyl-accepting chemotaxis sensory transducer with Cache sensor n=1 Tax=Pelosinus propionicus DSM 13327 TaxID=1123291 RepID=A0A1I4I6F3_9FIRM|nr:methyl-accepting chemotaxis protein [Pelosinus propionicus]SFL49266.1 methyl-accepting chemotaxis sensory transducer with Cache sensor [Pelosinus propionicus DSM 13327]